MACRHAQFTDSVPNPACFIRTTSASKKKRQMPCFSPCRSSKWNTHIVVTSQESSSDLRINCANWHDKIISNTNLAEGPERYCRPPHYVSQSSYDPHVGRAILASRVESTVRITHISGSPCPRGYHRWLSRTGKWVQLITQPSACNVGIYDLPPLDSNLSQPPGVLVRSKSARGIRSKDTASCCLSWTDSRCRDS